MLSGDSEQKVISVLTADGKIDNSFEEFLQSPDVQLALDVEPSSNAGPVVKCKNGRFKGIPFSSLENSTKFPGQNGASLGHGEEGILMAVDWSSGLTSSDEPPDYTQAWSLREVLKAFAVKTPENRLLNKILQTIGPLNDLTEIKDIDRILQVKPEEKYTGMWLIPGRELKVVTRLTFELKLSKALGGIVKALQEELPIFPEEQPDALDKLISSFSIHMQQNIVGVPAEPEIFTDVTFNLTVVVAIRGFLFWIEYNDYGVSCTLTEDPQSNADGFVSRLAGLGAGSDLSSTAVTPDFGGVFSNIDLWTVTIGKEAENKAYFLVELLVHWQAGGTPFMLGLSYDSRSKLFTGQLLFASSVPGPKQRISPFYDPRRELPTHITSTNLPIGVNLVSLFEESASAPEGLPSTITEAMVSFNSNTKTLYFSAVATGGKTPNNSDVPCPFTWDSVAVNVAYSKTQGTSFGVQAVFTLQPRPADVLKYSAAILNIEVSYVGGAWALAGSIQSLQFGLLGGYFENSRSDAFLDVLGKLTLKSLSIYYTFASSTSRPGNSSPPSKASSFLIDGILLIGELELHLIYQYASSSAGTGKTAAQQKLQGNPNVRPPPTAQNTTEWFFEADLRAAGPNATIGSVADSFVDNASDFLPDFVKSISLSSSSATSSLIKLKVAASGQSGVVCTLQVNIGHFELSILQISTGKNEPTKRVIRLTCDKIPLIDTIPLIKELPQPFDSLQYLWVLDGGPSPIGLTSEDVEYINKQIDDPKSKLVVKEVTNNTDVGKVALGAGHHFMIIDNGSVVLDHIFGKANQKPVETTDQESSSSANANELGDHQVVRPSITTPAAIDEASNPPNAGQSEVAPTKGAMAKKTQFLAISNVGLQYKSGTLWILLDVTLSLGPIEIALLGFGVGLPIGKKFDKRAFTLDNLGEIAKHIDFEIHGLGVSFEKPPLLLAGVFEHEVTETTEAYRGGIGLSFVPYMFVAVGEYAITRDPGKKEYKSVFVFAKLDGPLVTLEFATISGVRLGFGYNSMVRSPAIEELTDFPFVSDGSQEGSSNSPIKILANMTKGSDGKLPWVAPKEDAYWLAVGMTVIAFDLLSITAVAILAFRDKGIIASIYADAVAQMPPSVKERDAVILYVELGMVAEMNFVDDYFRAEASLAPTSFLLVPQCQLYGGFALCYWFGRNPHAGDWVFSVGGYHKSFKPPPWYPVPKRLGVNFQLGKALSVTAEAYFAVTPKVMMGGAMLHVSLDVGPVSAFMDASFDALINLEPVHYIADMRIAVGVSCDIHVLFIHIHISVEIGADLHIEGPEFGGLAHVDFYIFAFDISFGADNSIPDPLSLPAFYELVHKAGPEQTPTEGNPVKDDKTPDSMKHLKFTLEDGAFPLLKRNASDDGQGQPQNAGAGSKWHVKGGSFQFRIACDFALSSAHIQQDNAHPVGQQVTGTEKLHAVFGKPMRVSVPITSDLSVHIISKIHNKVVPGFLASYVLKPVPTTVWEQYNSSHDPMTSRDKKVLQDHLFSTDDPAVTLAMGVSLRSPPPQLALSPIPDFNPSEASKQAVYDLENATPIWWLAKTEPVQSGYMPDAINAAESPDARASKWAETREKWQHSVNSALVGDGAGSGSGMLGLCAEVLGWNKPDAAQDAAIKQMPAGVRKPWELKGGIPSKLVSGIDGPEGKRLGGLEEFYLALPQFCAAVV